MKNVIITVLVSIAVCLTFFNTPAEWYYLGRFFPTFGTAFTTISGSSVVANFPTLYNTNLANTANLTEANTFTAANTFSGATSFTGLASFANASSSLASCFGTCYFGGTATATISRLGVLTLPVALAISSGGTNATSITPNNTLLYFNGTSIVGTSTNPLYVDAIIASSTSQKSGFATSSPWALLSIHADGLLVPAFNIGSSTGSYFTINKAGGIEVSASQPATSTSITLDWANTPPQVEYRIGASATTIYLLNATTSQQWGSRKLVWICNPGETAGALTWQGVEWIGTAPSQSTSANRCDVYSFDVTRATSTSAYKVAGSAGTGFQ